MLWMSSSAAMERVMKLKHLIRRCAPPFHFAISSNFDQRGSFALTSCSTKTAFSFYAQAAEFSDVTILEGTVNQPAEDIVSNIVRRKPDVLAFSCYIWNISFIRFLLPLIREALPSVRIVLGGPEVSCNPKEILTENPDVDFVITGEGEVPFPLLLNALHQNADVSDVPGLFFRDRKGGVDVF
jgi:hypothetical protein